MLLFPKQRWLKVTTVLVAIMNAHQFSGWQHTVETIATLACGRINFDNLCSSIFHISTANKVPDTSWRLDRSTNVGTFSSCPCKVQRLPHNSHKNCICYHLPQREQVLFECTGVLYVRLRNQTCKVWNPSTECYSRTSSRASPGLVLTSFRLSPAHWDCCIIFHWKTISIYNSSIKVRHKTIVVVSRTRCQSCTLQNIFSETS